MLYKHQEVHFRHFKSNNCPMWGHLDFGTDLHLFQTTFVICWENNRDGDITMPLSLKTIGNAGYSDQWKRGLGASRSIEILESGKMFTCRIWNPGLWNPESSSRNPESCLRLASESKLHWQKVRKTTMYYFTYRDNKHCKNKILKKHFIYWITQTPFDFEHFKTISTEQSTKNTNKHWKESSADSFISILSVRKGNCGTLKKDCEYRYVR